MPKGETPTVTVAQGAEQKSPDRRHLFRRFSHLPSLFHGGCKSRMMASSNAAAWLPPPYKRLQIVRKMGVGYDPYAGAPAAARDLKRPAGATVGRIPPDQAEERLHSNRRLRSLVARVRMGIGADRRRARPADLLCPPLWN